MMDDLGALREAEAEHYQQVFDHFSDFFNTDGQTPDPTLSVEAYRTAVEARVRAEERASDTLTPLVEAGRIAGYEARIARLEAEIVALREALDKILKFEHGYSDCRDETGQTLCQANMHGAFRIARVALAREPS